MRLFEYPVYVLYTGRVKDSNTIRDKLLFNFCLRDKQVLKNKEKICGKFLMKSKKQNFQKYSNILDELK